MTGADEDFRGRPSRAALYRRVESEVADLDRRGGLPRPDGSNRVWEGVWLEETHHSTALEGNTLALKQVEALLADDRAVGGRELREYMEVRGYAAAARWVYEHARSRAWTTKRVLTRTEIRHVHQLCVGPVWEVAPHETAGPDERPGAFRRHDIRSFPSGMTPPPWPDVPAQLDRWTRALDRLRPRTPEFIERLAALPC